jgi:1,4-dihydroxy-2-naphthoate polyprenyltransferase
MDNMQARRLAAIARGLRLPFLTGSLLPVWAAAALVARRQSIDPFDLALATVAVGALHLASNLVNDAADSDNTDRINRLRTPFSGGSAVLLDGTLSARQLRWLVVGLVAVAAAAGVPLALRGRPLVWLFGGAGGLIGLCYSGAGLRLMSRGLGELAIFVAFGPLLTLGAGYALSGVLDPRQLALGALPGLLITAVLWINQFPDREADLAVGKRNLVVRLGLVPARGVYAALMLGPFPAVILFVALGVLPGGALGALLAWPLSLWATRLLWRAALEPSAVLPIQPLTIATHAILTALLSAGLLFAGRAV